MNKVDRHSIVTDISLSPIFLRSLANAAETDSTDWNSSKAALVGQALSDRMVVSLIFPHWQVSLEHSI